MILFVVLLTARIGPGLQQRGQKVQPHSVLVVCEVALTFLRPLELQQSRFGFFFTIFCIHMALGSSGQTAADH